MGEVNVVLVGMPAAGAKTLAARMATGSFSDCAVDVVAPTGGWTIPRPFESLQLRLHALGSQRGQWPAALSKAEVLAFVIDGSQEVDIAQVADTFNSVLKDQGLPEGVPVLVLFNKVDLISDATAEERKGLAAAALGASAAMRQCRVCSVSAQTGDGVDEAVRVM